jgi:hypothetical protein
MLGQTIHLQVVVFQRLREADEVLQTFSVGEVVTSRSEVRSLLKKARHVSIRGPIAQLLTSWSHSSS